MSMREIDYFTEEKMDRDSAGFMRTLPDSLKRSIRPDIFVSWGIYAALQGYKGPENFRNGSSGASTTLNPEDGVQEISFYHAISKTVNWIPIFGTLLFAAHRGMEAIGDWSIWCSLFFDEASGKHMSEEEAKTRRLGNKNSRAHNNKGELLLEEGKFEEAIAEFDKAKTACSSGYSMEETYLLNKKKALNKWTKNIHKRGCNFLEAGDTKEALAKFKEAHERSSNGGGANVDIYKDEMEKAERLAKKNDEADSLNTYGERLLREEKYQEAHEKFNEAIKACSPGYKLKESFVSNQLKAMTEWANASFKLGCELLQAGDPKGAAAKFKEAHERSSSGGVNIAKFKEEMEKAERLVERHERTGNSNTNGERNIFQGRFQDGRNNGAFEGQ